MNTSRESAQRLERAPLPALLYAIRGTYTEAVRRAQTTIGCDDVPASGEIILSAMEWSGASVESIVRFLGITKQAVSQTVEVLVARGYLERSRDAADRRRVVLSLTDRGHAAGRAARTAIEQVDRELRARVGAQGVARTRETLIALLQIKRRGSQSRVTGGT